MSKLYQIAVAVLCLGCWGSQASAQPRSSLIIDTNRPDRRPPSPPAEPPAPKAAASSVERRPIQPFILRQVRVSGASAPIRLLQTAWRPYLGRTVDGGALAQLTDAVAGAYSHSNVALYTVLLPNQTFAGGTAQVRVVEGYVQDVQITGDSAAKRETALVRQIARRMLGERPLRKSTLQRVALLIRDVPGLKADIQFLRGDAPGAVVVKIALTARGFELAAGINNRGTAELGRTQVELDFTANSLLRPGDMTRFTVVVPTDIQRFQYFALSHSELLTDDGLTASATAGYLRTRPASIPLHGSAVTGGLTLAYPVMRSDVHSLTVSGSVDGVNSDNALFGQLISDDHTRAARLTAAYSLTKPRYTLAASGALSLGLDALGAEVTSPLLSDRSFRKINARLSLDDQLVPQWVLRLRSIGQYSGDRLPAVEQMALGGDEFGRAFPSAAIIGDSGLAGSAELAFTPKVLKGLIKGSEVYGFVDGGKLWSQDRVILPSQSQGLSSTGFGARLAVAGKAVLQIEAAQALENPLPDGHDGWRVVVGYRTLY
jgi:hemolysin activation/secretion protein